MNREVLKTQLKSDEGYRQIPYQDSRGILTVGVGRNLTVGLSESEIDVLLENDIDACIEHALSIFPGWSSIPEPAQHVILNMLFQLGKAGFLKFRHFIAAVKDGYWDLASEEVLNSVAASQTPARYLRHSAELSSLINSSEERGV